MTHDKQAYMDCVSDNSLFITVCKKLPNLLNIVKLMN